MNKWQQFDIENKVTEILQDAPNVLKDHHLGQPFLTAYQIAIEFAERYPEEFKQLKLPIGGAGTGKHNSLAQYLAQQLSRNIKSKRITHIEGGFISNLHLHDINFDTNSQDRLIHSSLTKTWYTLSMFRLKNNE
jgi:hypothetical protein